MVCHTKCKKVIQKLQIYQIKLFQLNLQQATLESFIELVQNNRS